MKEMAPEDELVVAMPTLLVPRVARCTSVRVSVCTPSTLARTRTRSVRGMR